MSNEQTTLVFDEAITTSVAQATTALRFIDLDGRKILQQQWLIIHQSKGGYCVGHSAEWRDIPLEAA